MRNEGPLSFRELVAQALFDFTPNPRVIADHVGFSVSTLQRWAEGSSVPHVLVQQFVKTKLSNEGMACM